MLYFIYFSIYILSAMAILNNPMIKKIFQINFHNLAYKNPRLMFFMKYDLAKIQYKTDNLKE